MKAEPAGSLPSLQSECPALCIMALWETDAPLSSCCDSSSVVAACKLPCCLPACGPASPELELYAFLAMVCTVSEQASMQSAGNGDIRTCAFATCDMSTLTCRTPPKLLMVVDAVLAAYEAQHASGSMLKEAAALMKPEIISRLKELQQQIQKEFT